jgi:hypothetical protein
MIKIFNKINLILINSIKCKSISKIRNIISDCGEGKYLEIYKWDFWIVERWQGRRGRAGLVPCHPSTR